MGDKQVRVERINIKDVYEFGCRIVDESGPDDTLPITRHLALAHSKNPYADEDDPSLLVAYAGDKCVGYIGVFPGLLRNGDRLSKVFWGTTFYVAPEYRPYGVGVLLMKKALSLDIDMLGNYMSTEAEELWQVLGVVGKLGPRRDYVLKLLGLFEFIDNPLKIVEWALRKAGFTARLAGRMRRVNERVIYPRLRAWYLGLNLFLHRRALKAIRADEADQIPDDALDNVVNRPPVEFHRGVEWINWKLRYKWYLSVDESDQPYENFFFTGFRDRFEYVAVNVYSRVQQRYLGFLVLSASVYRDGRTLLKVLDYHPDLDGRYVTALTLKYARLYGADQVALPGQLRPHFVANVLNRIFLIHRDDAYVCRPRNDEGLLATSVGDIALNLCDGDYSFT